MTSSPFHGIFSSLGEEDSEAKSIFSFGSSKKSSVPPTPQPSANHAASPQDGIGRMAVDIYEQDDYYIIKAPIAGVRLSDLDIEVNENVLTIRGHRRQTDMLPQNQYYLQECYWGSFSRSITLPCQIDAKRVKATFNKDCILKVLVPKEEKIKIVRIAEG